MDKNWPSSFLAAWPWSTPFVFFSPSYHMQFEGLSKFFFSSIALFVLKRYFKPILYRFCSRAHVWLRWDCGSCVSLGCEWVVYWLYFQVPICEILGTEPVLTDIRSIMIILAKDHLSPQQSTLTNLLCSSLNPYFRGLNDGSHSIVPRGSPSGLALLVSAHDTNLYVIPAFISVIS